MELAEIFSNEKKGVEIIRPAAKKTGKKENLPNETTLNSVEKTSKGIGLTQCSSIDDLFEKLEL